MDRSISRLFVAGCLFAIVAVPGRAAALPFGGQPQTGTISSAAQSNSYTFSASANDVVDFTMVTTNGNLLPKIRLYNSAGTQISIAYNGNPYNCEGGSTIELNTVTLPVSGAYTVLVGDCVDTNTGNYTIYAQRTNNPAGAAALPFGQTQAGTISSAAQSNSYTFSASANDVVDFTMVTTNGNLLPKIRLYNSAGTQVGIAYNGNPYNCEGGSTIELNTVTLSVSGAYTVLVGDCVDTNIGNYTLYAQRTNNPAGAVALLFGGQPQTGIIGSAAQSNSYTFGANANDVVDFTVVATSGGLLPKIRLYSSAGTQLGIAYNGNPYNCEGGATIELNTVKLPATATYTVLIGDCVDTNTGKYNLSTQCFGVCASSVSTPLPQTVTFGSLNNQVLGTASFTLSATASSGLAVAFASNTPSVCTVSGSAVTLVAVGTCSITANQPGNSAYAAATPVTQTFAVAGTAGEILFDDLGSASTGGTPIASGFPYGESFSTGASAFDFTSVTVSLLNVSPAPTYTITALLLADTSTSPGSVLETIGTLNEGSMSYGNADYTFSSSPYPLTPNTRYWIELTSNDPNGGAAYAEWNLTSNLAGTTGTSGEYFFANGASVLPDGTYGAPQMEVSGETMTSPANCSFALAPADQVIPAPAGTGTVGVLTTAGCPWTASSGSSFLSIASGASGTGPGVVQFSATANSAPATRTGSVTIARQTATVNQTGTAPLLLLSPSSLAVQWRQQSQLPSPIQLSVFTAASSLAFTAAASSTGNWLTVSPTSGSAPGTIIVTVNPSSLTPGTYQGTVTVTAPTANPSSQSFAVTLTVLAAGLPTLSVATTNLSYSFAQGAQQVQQQRIPIANTGGGTLSYTSSASTSSGGNWLSVTQDAAGVTPTAPDLLTVNVNPGSLGVGTYTGQITITAAAATATIAVTVTVSSVQQTILLSQTGLTFTSVVNGGIVPPQTFGILNSGNGVMSWSVSSSTVTGGNGWLLVTPSSGSTDASSLTVPLVSVAVNPVNLTPGQYSGQIQVTSATANDSPQFVSVILNVLPAGSNPGPLVLPAGLIFTQATGGAAAGPQTITVSNLTGSQLTFATGKLTTDGANWFSVTPATGAAAPTQATTLTVSVSSTGLTPAIRQGVLTLLFQDGSVRTVNVLFLLANGGVSSNSAGLSRPLASGGSCTPAKLLPLVTSLGSQFTVPAGWPNTLATQVVDDCGNPHVTGTVTAAFSNGDPPLPLISLKNGEWTGTWQVSNAGAPVIAITVTADDPVLNISGSTSVSGGLQSSANAPVTAAGGVFNAASYSPSAPLSPGELIAIKGSNLANGTSSASTLPLPSELSGTLVVIGGQPAPLLYAGQGQINAIIPYGLPINTNTQVIVQQGNAYTSPQSITLSAANPGIFTTSASGVGQGTIFRPDGNYAQSGTPAQAGDEILLFAAGLGATNPPATAGQAPTSSPLLYVAAPVSLTIGGQNARVDFAGLAPGFPGVYQINAAVPAGVHGNAVPVVLTVAGQPSLAVTMAVQ